MNRAKKTMLAFMAALACLMAGCGGSGFLIEFAGPEQGLVSVTVSATAIYQVAGYEEIYPSKDSWAVGGAGVGAGGYGGDLEDIFESTDGLCDFVIEQFTAPNGYIETFDSRTGLSCAAHSLHEDRCLDCDVTNVAGSCRLDCTGYVPMDEEAAGESIELLVDNISTFKAVEDSAIGAVGLRTTVSDWPETDLSSSNAKGMDLTYCNGDPGLMKADPLDPESFQDITDDEWLYILPVTDLGTDKNGDGLTVCLVYRWVKTTISIANAEFSDSIHVGRGPIRFDARACSDPLECP